MAKRKAPSSRRSTVAVTGTIGPGANHVISASGLVHAAKALCRLVFTTRLNFSVRFSLMSFSLQVFLQRIESGIPELAVIGQPLLGFPPAFPPPAAHFKKSPSP